MKKITAIIFLILIGFSGFSQDKKTTTIIVTTTKTALQNKEDFIEVLLDNDYYIDTEKAGVITTELTNSKTKPNWSHQYLYKIRFKENSIIIKPFWNMGGITLDLGGIKGDFQNQPWKYHKGKNIRGFIFNETMEMLSSANYKDITFN